MAGVSNETISPETLAQLRQHIGREERAEDIVTARLVDQYRATFAPNLAAVGQGEAPVALHWCLATAAVPTTELKDDGHPQMGGFLPPVPLPRRMWAGGEMETLDTLRLGDRVMRISTVSDVTVKEGKSGLLCFVTLRHEVMTDRGIAIRERQDIVYRPEPAPDSARRLTRVQQPAADRRWTVEAAPTLLFRYSALTFNSHRIHYDLPYATETEGYSGLVVQGPLQASLLFNLAAVAGGCIPPRFRYAGLAPLTAGPGFQVNARNSGDGAVECWTSDIHGQINMKATATW